MQEQRLSAFLIQLNNYFCVMFIDLKKVFTRENNQSDMFNIIPNFKRCAIFV